MSAVPGIVQVNRETRGKKMRQIGSEKDDPLKRIQEEINEVARRERELREKMQLQQQQQQTPLEMGKDATPAASPTPSTHEDSSSGKPSLEEAHSDDSGFSASSSPVNGVSASSEKRYVRPNGYSSVPTPPPQKLLVRAMSTPQIFTPNSRRFSFNTPQKGIMQRFIASRGRLGGNQPAREPGSQPLSPLDRSLGSPFMLPATVTPPIIERDADGKPIRRGYVPVEEKIQKELKDLKSRETELKRMRKLRQSQPDLLDSIEDERSIESDDDSDLEHCFPPGKLRSSKSIGELCDTMSSLSPTRTTPSPDLDRKMHQSQLSGIRPAVSLAQLCDLDPEKAPSSHRLIAKWESMIQRNA